MRTDPFRPPGELHSEKTLWHSNRRFSACLCRRICDEWNKFADRHQDHHQGRRGMRLSRFANYHVDSCGRCVLSLATLCGRCKVRWFNFPRVSTSSQLDAILVYIMLNMHEHTGIRQSFNDISPFVPPMAYVLSLFLCLSFWCIVFSVWWR